MSEEPENIDKIRDILFGEQMRSTSEKIASVHAEFSDQLEQHQKLTQQRFDKMEQTISRLEEKLLAEDAKIREVHVERKKLANLLRNISDKLSPETK